MSIAIVDGSGQASDHDRGVFAVGEIGSLIGVEHAGAAIERLRNLFSARIREEVAAACRDALAAIGDGDCRDRGDPYRSGNDGERSGPLDSLDDIDAAGHDWFRHHDAFAIRPGAHDRRACGQEMRPGPAMRRIAVGFARVSGDP